MKIATSKLGLINVIAPHVPFTGANIDMMKQAIQSHLKNGSTKLLLDFSGVSHLDSQGLEMLLDSYEELKKHGGDIKLCNVNQLCTDILIATRLSSFLEVYKNTEEAAQSYL